MSTPAWQRKEGKNPKGGLNAKGRASYNRATGGNLKAPTKKKGEQKKKIILCKNERYEKKVNFCKNSKRS